MSIKIGDRVKAIGGEHSGLFGTVVDISGLSGSIGVEYDERIVGGHTCSGHGKAGYCWYEVVNSVEKASGEEDLRLT